MINKKNRSNEICGYWIKASSEFHQIKSLIIAGLTIALGTMLSSLNITVGLNLRISFTFIALALGSMIFGPLVGLFTGFAYDLINFIIFPSPIFFAGYTLSAMLEFFLYGLFLYRSRLTVIRIIFMELTVNLIIYIGLGSLWSSMMYGRGYYYFLIKSIVKNTIMLPIKIVILVMLIQLLLPVLIRERLINKQNGRYIPFI